MNSRPLRPEYAGLLSERRHTLRARLEGLMAPGEARFLWEVGCGHGHFLTAYAAAHPEKLCLGVDLASERIARAEKKRQRALLANLHFIRADARLFLEALPSTALISELFILFPDPWPKSRHHKHRVLQPRFLELVAAHTAPGCRLYFRTDHAPYFADAQAIVRASAQWELVAEPWPFEFETVFQRRARHHESLIARLRDP
jgi:tRNA (guanine-N7-)-methyltransferase